jgi:hypothetical protein
MSASKTVTVERLEALLRGDPPRTPAEERRAALLDELRAGALHAPPALRARVAAAGAAPRRRLAFPQRRLALAVVPFVAAAAVVAAVVHGIVGSSGSSPRPVAAREAGRAVHGAGAPVPFGAATPAPSAAAPVQKLPSTGSGARLQHTDASLEVEVAGADRVSAATTKAARIASELGGYAQSVRFDSSRDGSGSAQLDLRVPAANVRSALARLETLGSVVSQTLSQEDLQRLFAQETSRIAQLRRRVAALAKAVAEPSLPEAQRILVGLRLSEARRSLAQALAARKGTLAAAADARISLLLTTKPKAAAVAHQRGRLGRMIHSAAGFLALEGTIALYALVVLSPLLVLAATAWWLVRLRRRREERRLLAA